MNAYLTSKDEFNGAKMIKPLFFAKDYSVQPIRNIGKNYAATITFGYPAVLLPLFYAQQGA
jgi:hypothetical protein